MENLKCYGCEFYDECVNQDNLCEGCKHDGDCELQSGCWMCKMGEYLQCNNGYELESDYDCDDEDDEDEAEDE